MIHMLATIRKLETSDVYFEILRDRDIFMYEGLSLACSYTIYRFSFSSSCSTGHDYGL